MGESEQDSKTSWDAGRAAAAGIDTAERRQAQLLVDVLENTSDAFFAVDKDWLVVQVNGRHERWINIARADQFGKSIFDLFPQAKNPRSKAWIAFHQAMHGRVHVHFEDTHPPLKTSTSVDVYPTPGGGLAVFYRDATAETSARQHLERENAKFESLFSDTPAAMAMLRGSNFLFEKANAAWDTLMAARAYMDMRFEDVCPELSQVPYPGFLKNVLATGKPRVVPQMWIAERCYNISYVRILDINGAPYGIHCHAVDVTREGQSERSMQQAVKSRDAFLGMASQVLQTHIASIKHQSQSVLHAFSASEPPPVSPEQLVSFAQSTARQAERLDRLANEMQDVARIALGQFALAFDVIDFSLLLQVTLQHFLPEFDGAGCAVSMQVSMPLWVRGDRARIAQVLATLMAHIIRYAPQSHVAIVLTKNAPFIELTLHDTGPGIAADKLPLVFERFASQPDPEAASGLGVGLYIAKQIIVAHGGSISAESTQGQGSTFRVALPAVNQPAA